MKTLVLQAQTAPIHYEGTPPEGLIVEKKAQEVDGETYTDLHVRYPEAGPPRYFTAEQVGAGLVLPIAGRRWRVHVDVAEDRYCGIPEGASVTFVPTEEEETPSQPWDEAERLREYRVAAVARIADMKATIAELPDEEDRRWYEGIIRREERDVARMEAGEFRLHHRYYAQVFGQPHFLQNEMFPVHEGRCAMHLMTLDTEWGDAGNVNLMFHLDADGIPCALWFEASCC